MGAAASSRAAADTKITRKNATGRHMIRGLGSGDEVRGAPAKLVASPADAQLDSQSTGEQRRRRSRDKGDKRATQSADGVLRRVRSKRRHVAPDAPQRPAQPIVGSAKPDVSASAFVSLREPEAKKAAAPPLSSSPEVAEVFKAATLPAMHLSVRTRRDPGDAASRRRHRQRSDRVAAVTPPQPQSAAQAAVAHAVAQATLRRGSKSSSSSSGEGGHSSMAATVHSLGRSLRRISIGSGAHSSPVNQRRHAKEAPAAACHAAVTREPRALQTSAVSGTVQSPQSPGTPSTDAGSCGIDAMSAAIDLHLAALQQPRSDAARSPPAFCATAAAAKHVRPPAAVALLSPASCGSAGGQTPGERPPCGGHPLDGTPRSLVRHPLQRAWPSSGHLSARMRTVSTDSTWVPQPGAAAAADDDSASEWSALEVRAPRERWGHGGQPSDDSDSDSEFWGGLAARAAAVKRQLAGPPAASAADLDVPPPASDMEARSLAYSRAVAAAQHPVFDLANPEEAVMAQNAALYRELLR